MDSMGTSGLLPLSPLQQAMSARGCTPPIIQISTRGLLSHHHITLILLTQVIRDQSHHIITTHKRVGKVTEAMVVRRVMFRLQGLANDEGRPEISMELVEGAPENHPSESRSALAVRCSKALSGERDRVGRRICVTRKFSRVIGTITPLMVSH